MLQLDDTQHCIRFANTFAYPETFTTVDSHLLSCQCVFTYFSIEDCLKKE